MKVEITKEEVEALIRFVNKHEFSIHEVSEVVLLENIIEKASHKPIFTNVIGEDFFEGENIDVFWFDKRYLVVEKEYLCNIGTDFFNYREDSTCIFRTEDSLRKYIKTKLEA